ncbi:Ribosome biogenesis ATPase rix7 [Recurvomyces mirabilis]|uniref:Ribosome biogenesis ATPase rix7 n=1 Tax=Recurvomyces mirabilis TaxID=574656 RepID=A0AAE0WFY3_9PEZI|nr:Ribosome biogenesis ATPase rix7 [Recurvomyces mirabilis]KAK5160134.1 Ribosome biogenesis ATPase rix7 [Recurvomyces mirabilis]
MNTLQIPSGDRNLEILKHEHETRSESHRLQIRAMQRLQGALDNDILTAARKFLEQGVPPQVDELYTALQRSNSSLKRRPKKVLHSSLERVLDFLGIPEEPGDDSDAAIEQRMPEDTTADIMNRSLRANLAPTPVEADSTPQKRRTANGEPLPKRQKAEKPSPGTAPTDVSLDDIGGIDEIIDQMERLLVRPLLAPQTYAEMHVPIPRGILLHGPPGCGKTMLSRAFAAEMGLPFIEILGPSIVSGMSGESERGLRERFEEAKKNAPCIIFLDEIDAIAPKRDTSQSQMEKRIVAQLLVSMDDLDRDQSKPVIVLATTNRPDAIDPALRRGGRFDTEINIPVPNEGIREHILRAQTRRAPISADVDFKQLAKRTAGFVGSDLHDLVGKAGSWQLEQYFCAMKAQGQDMNMDIDSSPETAGKRVKRFIARLKRTDIPKPPGFEDNKIAMSAFDAVLPHITPSSKREGFATIPDVSWSDIGALQSVREELQTAIVEPIRDPDLYASIGITAPAGVLLWGPPGCGKTLLAKAVAAESKANFISVKGPELIDKFVGESEAAVRRVFSRARSSVPCVIFFDELDALVPRRDSAVSDSSARVVNTLLTELDGLSDRKGIFVIAATNRPDVIDEAMMRPGRLETPLFVDLPGPEERVEILKALLRGKPIGKGVSGVEMPLEHGDSTGVLASIVALARTEACKDYSGADLGALVRQAGMAAIKRKSRYMEIEDFRMATDKIKGSVGDMKRYYRLRDKFGKS